MTDPYQTEARAWSSHLPALLAAIAASEGPVLELGVGHFSTPELHAVCGALNRELWSVENHKEWHDEFAKKYKVTGAHFFECMNYPEALKRFRTRDWGVAFIDHSPGGANRAEAFLAFRDISQFVVVHDYHLENWDAIQPHLGGMNYYVTETYQPPTLIASVNRKIPAAIIAR